MSSVPALKTSQSTALQAIRSPLWVAVRAARRLAGSIAVCAALGAAADGGTDSRQPGAALAPAPAAEHAAPFRLTAAQMASIKVTTVQRVRFRSEHPSDGRIGLNADRTTPVFSPYSGRVAQVLAKPGDLVRQGQPLLAVQATEFVQGQSDLLSAQSTLASAQSQLSLARSSEHRKHALFDAKAGSKADWEQAQNDLAAAQGAVRTGEAALAAVRNRLKILGRTDDQIDALGRAEQMDALAYVLAPIAGTVTDKQVGVGQYLQAGAASPVFTVGDLSTVWLIANVREADAPFVRKGQAVEVQVPALPGRTFQARITYVAPALDPATRRRAVRAEIANPDGLLTPEMFARFSIISGGESSAPAVPESGVIYEGSEARVWIVADDGSLALRRIRVGRFSNGQLEVLEGVAPGEKVVASGALFIDRAARGE